MKVRLFDFQENALLQLREKVFAARNFASSENPQAIAFSAPTGSGKTIILTALFEDILFGAPGLPAQPNAAILWVSDMPELNEQTRLKIEGKSDRVRVRQLMTIDSNYDAEQLEGGQIYFMNTQKLGSDKLLTKTGDGRRYSIWQTLSNTAKATPNCFYVIIDEAHRGMSGGRAAIQAQTIMQRFLLGYGDDGLITMPLVIGVSATPKRFLNLVEHAPHTVHKVSIPASDVRESGLLKDRILIHHPETQEIAEMSLLHAAATRWQEMRERWRKYCEQEAEPLVAPILVVQIENGNDRVLSRTDLSSAIRVIENAIGRELGYGEAAHAMHDTGDLELSGRRVRKVDASRIEESGSVGIVLFKTSLSTGWDCPRAEVMMSFRPAQDHTYIAQLLGRMVRTPLARRIERDTALNDVHLFLPYFDAAAVQSVVEDLRNVEDVPPSETGSSRELIILNRRPGTEVLFQRLSELTTYRIKGARQQSNLRRVMGLARGLTMDEVDDEAWGNLKTKIVNWLDGEITRLKASGEFGDRLEAVIGVGLQTTAVEDGGSRTSAQGTYRIGVSSIDIDTRFDEAGRRLGNGLHMEYWQTHGNRNAYDVKAELIVLAQDSAILEHIESLAENEFDRLFDAHRRAIGKLREQRRILYEKLRVATAVPRDIDWVLPDTIDFRRDPRSPVFDRHLYIEADQTFRTALGPWELGVITEEISKDEVKGWLRNIDRKPWSLEIPYESGGAVKPMFPDFVVIRQRETQYLIDILEPHDPSLADNFEKAIGLARFAEKHGHLFDRIELIRKGSSLAGGKKFFHLNVNQEAIRKEVLLMTSNSQLDVLFDRESHYKEAQMQPL
jgi:type III restriction enzyme